MQSGLNASEKITKDYKSYHLQVGPEAGAVPTYGPRYELLPDGRGPGMPRTRINLR
jgi:hypothetical protein